MNSKVIGGILAGVAIVGAVGLTIWDYKNTQYECHECGEIYKPTKMAYGMGMKVPTRRFMKCPYCGVHNWHYRKYVGMRPNS